MRRDSGDPAHRKVYADLVDGLLDARDDPATARFDAELDAAVANGAMTSATARRLRFWQRASLRALADHTRAVLPTALGALDASRREARATVDELAATLGPAEPAEPAAPAEGVRPTAPRPQTSPPLGDTPEPASAAGAPPPPTLEPGRNRLFVADLVTAVPKSDPSTHEPR